MSLLFCVVIPALAIWAGLMFVAFALYVVPPNSCVFLYRRARPKEGRLLPAGVHWCNPLVWVPFASPLCGLAPGKYCPAVNTPFMVKLQNIQVCSSDGMAGSGNLCVECAMMECFTNVLMKCQHLSIVDRARFAIYQWVACIVIELTAKRCMDKVTLFERLNVALVDLNLSPLSLKVGCVFVTNVDFEQDARARREERATFDEAVKKSTQLLEAQRLRDIGAAQAEAIKRLVATGLTPTDASFFYRNANEPA